MSIRLPNAIWSWWTWPRAVQCGTFTYVGNCRDDATYGADVILPNRVVSRMRLTTNENTVGDDHCNTAVVAVAGKPLVIFYTKHNGDQFSYWSKFGFNADAFPGGTSSIPAQSSASWALPRTINFAQALPDPTNNTIHLFATITNEFQGYARSENWATDFTAQPMSPATQWLDFGSTMPPSNTASFGFAWYRQFAADATKCHVLLAAGYESARAVRYCQINLATGDISKSDGTVLGNLRTGVGLPVSAKEADSPLEIVYQAPAGKCLNYVTDITSGTNPEGCFCEYDLTNPDTASNYYWCQRQTDNSWLVEQIVNAGPRFTTAPSTGYHSNVQMVPSGGAVLLGRNPTGAGGFVNGMWAGASWNIEKWTRTSPSVWASTVLQTDPTNPLVRPFPIEGAGSPFTYAYMRAIDYTSWNNCSGELVVA